MCIVVVLVVIAAVFVYREASISQSFIFDAVEKKVSNKMKDPESAIFRDLKSYAIKVNGDTQNMTVCGFVNSKNSYGAYSGSHVFSSNVTIQGYSIDVGSVVISNSDQQDEIILSMCNES